MIDAGYIRQILERSSACALDDETDRRTVLGALLEAFEHPHWRTLGEVLDSPYCTHCDCAGNLFPVADVDRATFTWRCEECQAYTVVDLSSGLMWTEPETRGR